MSRTRSFTYTLKSRITQFLFVGALLALVGGYFSNLIWTFNQTETAQVLLGIFGAVVPPFGALHGLFCW